MEQINEILIVIIVIIAWGISLIGCGRAMERLRKAGIIKIKRR